MPILLLRTFKQSDFILLLIIDKLVPMSSIKASLGPTITVSISAAATLLVLEHKYQLHMLVNF